MSAADFERRSYSTRGKEEQKKATFKGRVRRWQKEPVLHGHLKVLSWVPQGEVISKERRPEHALAKKRRRQGGGKRKQKFARPVTPPPPPPEPRGRTPKQLPPGWAAVEVTSCTGVVR